MNFFKKHETTLEKISVHLKVTQPIALSMLKDDLIFGHHNCGELITPEMRAEAETIEASELAAMYENYYMSTFAGFKKGNPDAEWWKK